MTADDTVLMWKYLLVNERTNMLNTDLVWLLSVITKKHKFNVRFHDDQSFALFNADTHTLAAIETETVMMFSCISS